MDFSYRNGPETCTFYPSPMLYKYIDRCICLKPFLQRSNLLVVDKIEIGGTSSLLRRTEKDVMVLFFKVGSLFKAPDGSPVRR